MHVSAKELRTGKEQRVAVTGGSALPQGNLERMVREAERCEEQERQRRNSAETRDRANQLVYAIERFIQDHHADTVPIDIKTKAEAAVGELKEALKNGDDAAVHEATENAAITAQKLRR